MGCMQCSVDEEKKVQLPPRLMQNNHGNMGGLFQYDCMVLFYQYFSQEAAELNIHQTTELTPNSLSLVPGKFTMS